jgi:hypothetical protein
VILDFFLKLLETLVLKVMNWLWGSIMGQLFHGGAGEFGCKYARYFIILNDSTKTRLLDTVVSNR